MDRKLSFPGGGTRNEHPRPDFQRAEWLCLNGAWAFEYDDRDCGEKERWYLQHQYSRHINVPFSYQSELSGIGSKDIHNCLWYQREFELPASLGRKRIFLKFGAVDFYAKVWVNGIYLGDHAGGYTPFSFDVTEALQNSNTVVLRVEDRHFDRSQPRGKQMWTEEPFGCWYTGFSGIWQTVWIEAVAEVSLESIKLIPDIDQRQIELEVFLNGFCEGLELHVVIELDRQPITAARQTIGSRSVKLAVRLETDRFAWNGIQLWTPETPNLYDIELKIMRNGQCLDCVRSYFGMRAVSVQDNRFLLNHVPYYQKLILDQGYYARGGITAANEAALINDLEMIKKMGFNGLRMHQKIEEPLFLYWCDRLGLLVWEEMPSFYRYDETAVKHQLREWPEVIARDYNHPAIVTWVPFNESWGVAAVGHDATQQNYIKSIYYLTKSLDNTRLVIDNDGWEHTDTDICTIHDYEQDGERLFRVYANPDRVLKGAPSAMYPRFVFAAGYGYKNQPVMISECGGIAFSGSDGWGYGDGAANETEFMARFQGLLDAVQKLDYVCGYCYTQLTDVEQERNGLMTMARQMKIDPEAIRRINARC